MMRRRLPLLLLLLASPLLAASGPFEGWTTGIGAWTLQDDVYVQSDMRADCRAFAPLADWTDYTYELKARKVSGNEAFLILFRVKDRNSFYWWNIGGWGNSRHALETRPQKAGFPSVPGRVETGRWYDIKIVVQGPSIKCYLDGKLIHDAKNNRYPKGGIGLGTWSTQVEYKDISVTAPDGATLYGAEPMELVESTLKSLGDDGAPFRAEAETLRKAKAPLDDARWTALYHKMAGVRERIAKAEQSLAALDLKPATNTLQLLLDTAPKAKARAEAMLKQLPVHEKNLAALRQAASKGNRPDPAAIEAIQKYADDAKTLHQSLYTSRCPPVAFIHRHARGRNGTNATMHGRGTGTGSAICIYDPAEPEAGAKTIFDDPEGFIFDMTPSFDGKKLIFAYKKKVQERKDSFHIYDINTDGTDLRQITTGRFHDVSPVYLPDGGSPPDGGELGSLPRTGKLRQPGAVGRIVFNSTRVESFSLCQNFLAAALFTIRLDGTDLRRLEYNTLCDTTPYVMDDGSILFTRWEYQDKNIFCTEALWTINPDGSRVQLFYGNTLTIPNALYGAKQIPGTRKVIAVGAAHHHPPLGAICIIDRTMGHENVEGIRNITPEVPYTPTVGKDWREKNWGPGDRLYPWSYTDPWPLAEDLFLVSYGGPAQGGPQRYRLFLLDDKGHKIPLYDDAKGKLSCYNPVPLRPRPLPHRYPGQAPELAKGEGRFFLLDVYQGLEDKGVARGMVKQIRVMSQLPKTYNTEGPRYSDHYPAIGEGTYYVKHNYGTVPVHEDGSAYFTAPAGVELYFQALDEHGKEIRRMGTVTQITDGETQSCIGCHESRTTAPPVVTDAWKRLSRKPDPITPPTWGAGPVDFVKHVQPALDRYCAKCHSGPAPDKDVDLSGDKTRLFSMAFETLVFRGGLVARYHLNPGPTGSFPPLATGSWVSGLTKLIEEKHEKVDMDPESRRRIYTWIDANVPYYATWDMSRPYTYGGRDTWRDRGNKPQPWFADLAKAYAALQPPDPKGKKKRDPLAGIRNSDINLTHPAWSLVLTRDLAKSAGGRAEDKKALFKTTDDPRYRAILAAIEKGKQALLAKPRMDMPGGVAIAQQRDFGRTY